MAEANGSLEVALEADVIGTRLAQTGVMLGSWFSFTSLAVDRSFYHSVIGLSDRVEYICDNFLNFFGIPHSVFEGARSTFLTLLTEQLEEHGALIGGMIQIEDEDDAAFHRRPRLTASLTEKSYFRAIMENFIAAGFVWNRRGWY